jgi:hypothetical protein
MLFAVVFATAVLVSPRRRVTKEMVGLRG